MLGRATAIAFLGATLCLGPVAWAQQSATANTTPEPQAHQQKPALQEGASEAQADIDNGLLPPGEDPENSLGLPLIRHLASDQKRFWNGFTGVADKRNAYVVLPFAGFTGALIAGDSWISRQADTNPSKINRNLKLSNYSAYSLIGTAGGAYFLGALTHNDHLRETGFLSGESAVNATGITYLLKAITQRPRPQEGNGNGNFFQGGYSFPSEHSAIAWSVASVLAHEYPGPLTKAFAYGLASAVTIGRVTAKQHFSSDVWIGSVLGWYVGRQVYRAHHDVELGGAPWGSAETIVSDRERNPAYMASPYVPLDSWIYPDMERLVGQGFIQTAYIGMRPWTRMQCAQMVQEAENDTRYESGENLAAMQVIRSLHDEFTEELQRLEGTAPNAGITLESVYSRVTGISGSPLRDGYHFGQTVIDDFGRPYGNGLNSIMGTSARAVAGPFAFYIRGEYQQAGSVTPFSQNAVNQIAISDFRLLQLNSAPAGYSIYTGSYDRFRLLEGTVSLALNNVQFTFGKQSLWLGPSNTGALLFSNNAEPITMLRIDSVTPYHIPLLSSIFGRLRSEYFLGQLSGHQWIYQPPTLYGPSTGRQPFIHGVKSSFKPTDNLEFGFGFTALFGGPGLPFTLPEFLKTFYSHKANLAENPGKRFSSFDLTYRVPKLRDWLTAYVDTLVVDEVSPVGSSRPSFNVGLQMTQLPKLPNTQLRVEGFKTDHPAAECCFPGSVYYDLRYIQGYTNNGNLLGSWIGRGGYGGDATLTHWFSARNKLEATYRHQEVDRAFVGGGRTNDFSVASSLMIGPQVSVSGLVQYEKWRFPVLASGNQSDVTGSVQLTFWPKWKK